MESQKEPEKPVNNGEGKSKLPPEVVVMLKHGRELFHSLEGRTSIFPTEYLYVEEAAKEAKPTDIMGLAMLMENCPGVHLTLGRFGEIYPIMAMENLRKKQIASIRLDAQRDGVDVDEIYRRDKATADEVLKKVPVLLNPHGVSMTPELKEKVSVIVGQEEYGVFMGKIIPNIVTARRLQEIARVKLSQELSSDGENT